MNYEPNETDWQIGDIVIHDVDKKVEHMLMKIIAIHITKEGTLYDARYAYASNSCNQKIVYTNDKKFLHNPKRFNIEIPQNLLQPIKNRSHN